MNPRYDSDLGCILWNGPINAFLVEKYEDVVKFYFRSLKDTSEKIHLSCDFAEKELFSLILFKNFKKNFVNTTVETPYFRTLSSNCVL